MPQLGKNKAPKVFNLHTTREVLALVLLIMIFMYRFIVSNAHSQVELPVSEVLEWGPYRSMTEVRLYWRPPI